MQMTISYLVLISRVNNKFEVYKRYIYWMRA